MLAVVVVSYQTVCATGKLVVVRRGGSLLLEEGIELALEGGGVLFGE